MSKIRLHGSSSGYTEIAPVAASGNNTLTLPDDGTIISKDAAGAIGVTSVHTTNITATGIATITTAKIGAGVTITESGIEASGIGITIANINGTQIGGRRNFVINGAMQVAQRGSTNLGNSDFVYGAVDRYKVRNSNDGTITTSQSTTSPNGFGTSLKIDVTGADTNLTTSQVTYVTQFIEAQNLQGISYGTSDAKTLTVSFYVRSNKTGTYAFRIQNADNSYKQIGSNYTINSADTWERKIITIPGDTAGASAIDSDTGTGLELYWPLAAGPTYTSGSVPTTHTAYANGDFAAGQTVNIMDSTSNEWYLTGVQLEIGSQATAFEHRSFGDELILCQRYFQFLGGSNGSYDSMATGSCASSTIAYVPHRLLNTMRSTPSFTLGGSASDFRYTRGSDQTPSALALDQAGVNMVAIRVTTSSTSADAATRLFNVNTTGSLQFDAEL